jgi:hypothetical protein
MRFFSKLSLIGFLVSVVFGLASCGGGGGGGGAPVITPSGSGSITLDPVTKVIAGSFTTVNVTNATSAHIHDGNVGVEGPIVIGLLETTPGTWMVPANTVLNDAQIARLQAGGYYVNVHTTQNPNGEIRGQLMASSTAPNTFMATLTRAQETSAPMKPVPVPAMPMTGY